MSKKPSKSEEQRVELDLNNPQFQAALFNRVWLFLVDGDRRPCFIST
jgi:hypothetical protein